MQIRLTLGRGSFPDWTADYVRTRLAFALGRFAPRLASVVVRIDDLNGPRGGEDTRCTIRVRMKGRDEFVVHDTATDARQCVDRAADRMQQLVARVVDRIRDPMRRRAVR